MSLSENAHFNPVSSSTINKDYLIREIVGTHDPDDRELDSVTLLNLLESTFCFITDNVVDANFDEIVSSDIDLTGSKEPISLFIYKISKEVTIPSPSYLDLIRYDRHEQLQKLNDSLKILVQCFEDETMHRKTRFLLDTLSRYKWDAKVVLALASFAHIFGLFMLVSQQQSSNALAVSLATVKRIPRAIGKLNPKFKALSLLINTMVKLTKFVISFEGVSMHHELVDDNAMDITKSKIYMATYWIIRSVLVCSSEIMDLRNLRLEQVYSDKSVIAAWGLHSVGTKLSSLCGELGEYVDTCQRQIETRLHDKLLHMFKENKDDNQMALRTLFASHNKFPFKNTASGEKCGIDELKDKIVILLISKPELLPIDKLFFLVQQTCHCPNHPKAKENYTVLWVPVHFPGEWTNDNKMSFELISNYLPWLSVRKPWSLNSTIINYIKHEWDFVEDPIMVVLDENGNVTNTDAMDMVWIWGSTAFPFSVSREKEMWGQANWDIGFIINGITTLSSEWVEEGKNLCIFGSDDVDWIREHSAKMKIIRNAGTQLEILYVGCNKRNVKTIIDTIDQENLCHSLTLNKAHLFWFRLETIKRSIDRRGLTARSDIIAKEVSELVNKDESWALIGSSTDVIKLDQEKIKGFVDLYHLWSQNVARTGLVGAIRSVVEGPFGDENCHHDEVVDYEEGLIEKTMVCGSCKRPVEKFIVYKCDG